MAALAGIQSREKVAAAKKKKKPAKDAQAKLSDDRPATVTTASTATAPSDAAAKLSSSEVALYRATFASTYGEDATDAAVDDVFKKALSRATGNGHALELAHAVERIGSPPRADLQAFVNACASLRDPP